MSFLSFFKKPKKSEPTPFSGDNLSKEDIFRKLLEQQASVPVSEQFVSGAVFDISRNNRDVFLSVVQSGNALSLCQLFAQSYALFLEHPECVGFTPQMIRKDTDDTDIREWNADVFDLSNGNYMALLYMPVQNDTYSARIVGIIFGEETDGYYYCMLNKDEQVLSDVNKNNGLLGIKKVGSVQGAGFELMRCFFQTIFKDFSA